MDKRRMFFRFKDGYVCNVAYILSVKPIDNNNANFTVILPNNQASTIKASMYDYRRFTMDFV